MFLRFRILALLVLFVAIANHAQSALIALVNSTTANATFNTNFQAYIEGKGHTFVRNPSSYIGVNLVFNIRQAISGDLKSWVEGGGYMITEYSGLTNAGTAGLINYSDTGGSNAGTGGIPVTFTAAGIAKGLNTGLANPYNGGIAAEFFRNGIVLGSGVEILATRGASLPAIVGSPTINGSGYVLGFAYDWGDAFTQTPPLTNTVQLIDNALTLAAVPEPGTWGVLAVCIMGFVFNSRGRR